MNTKKNSSLFTLKEEKKFEFFFKSYLKDRFSKTSHPAQKLLRQSLFYTLFASSSYFRPRLAMAVTSFLKKKPEHIFPWAAALEMIHSASLLHDDLPAMDNEKTRRGKKCNHLVFGEDIALLAGSCLFVEAFSLLTQPSLQKKGETLLELLVFKTGFYGLMSGQALDLKGSSSSPQAFLQLSQLKTGSLIEAAIEGPLLLWCKSPEEKKILQDYARFMGPAYQLADDLEDGDTPLKTKKKAEDLLKSFTEKSLKTLKPLKKRGEILKHLSLSNQNRAF